MKRNRSLTNRFILCATGIALVIAAFAAAPADAETASAFSGLELTGGGKLPSLQLPGASLLAFSLGVGSHLTGSGWGGSGYVPNAAPELTVKARLDGAEASALTKAATDGSHYKSGALTWTGNGKGYAYCLTDVFVDSLQFGVDLKSPLIAEIGLAYSKLTVRTGAQPSCSGNSVPAVQSNLLGLRGKSLLARVDCLSVRCRGLLAVSLPSSACRSGPSKCSYTGGVRVGLKLNKLGKVHFNPNGTASFTGGVKVGLGGAGKFSMGDGSVKILKLHVPAPLFKWLNGHRHATLGAIIVVRGRNTALIQHDVLNPPAKLPSGVPSEVQAAPGNEEGPADQPQSLAVTGCSTPVVGTPTVVTVSGSLSPPRGGASVTLTYTPLNGPLPLPAPVVDSATTNAAGNFEESFDRQREGKPYSWEVVASIAAGGGFAAAQSPPCSIPIP